MVRGRERREGKRLAIEKWGMLVGSSSSCGQREGRHADGDTDTLKTWRWQELHHGIIAYPLVVEGTMGRLWVTGDEAAAAEVLREVVELGATGREKLGEEVEKLPELTTVMEEVRGTRELACSPRSTELRSGGASVDLDHRSSLCSNGGG